MMGTFLDYQPGRLEVKFSHDVDFDYINLDVYMTGSITTTTDCDKYGQFGQPNNYKQGDQRFAVYITSVFCPFSDFIRFLEAITLDVQECAFDWDPEGPWGEMRWQRRIFNDTGFLTISWQSRDESFSHKVMLNTRQAVRALYHGFRDFVESADYNPFRYEELSIGEALTLVLSDASLEELANHIVQLDDEAATTVMMRFREAMSARKSDGSMQAYSLAYFLDTKDTRVPLSEYDRWISPGWDSMDHDQRHNDLKDLYKGGAPSWYGANLRQLRSSMIENWLALPEPPPHRPYRIPVRIDNSESK